MWSSFEKAKAVASQAAKSASAVAKDQINTMNEIAGSSKSESDEQVIEDEVGKLKSQLKLAVSKAKKLKEERDVALEQMKEHNPSQVIDIKEKLKQVVKKATEMKVERDSALNDLKQSQAEIESMKSANNSNVPIDVQKKDQTIDDLKSKLKELIIKFKSLRESSVESETMVITLQEKNKKSEGELNTMTSQIESLVSEKIDLKQAVEDLKSEVRSSAGEQMQSSDVEDFQRQMIESESKLAKTTKKLRSMQDQLMEYETQNDNLETQVQRLQKSEGDLKEHIEELARSHLSDTERSLESRSSLEDKYESLTLKFQQFKIRTVAQDKEHALFKETAEASQQALSNAKKELDALRNSQVDTQALLDAELTKVRNALTAEKIKLDGDYANELERLHQRIGELESEHAALLVEHKAELESNAATIDELEAQTSDSISGQLGAADFQAQLQACVAENGLLHEKLQSLQQSYEALERKNDELRVEKSELSNVEDIEEKLESSLNDLTCAQTELNKIRNSLLEQNKTATNLEQENENLKASLQQLAQENRIAMEEKDIAFEKKLVVESNAIHELKSDNLRLTQDLKMAEEQLEADVEDLKASLQQLTQENQSVMEEKDIAFEKTLAQLKSSNERIGELEADLSGYVDLQMKVESMEQELVLAREGIVESNCIDELKSENSKLTHDLKMVEEQLEAEVEELKARLQQLTQENQSVMEEKDIEFKKKLVAESNAIDELKNENLKLIQDVKQIEEQFQVASGTLVNLRSQLEEQSLLISKSELLNENMENQQRSFTKRIDLLNATIETLEMDISKSNEEKTLYVQKIATLQASVDESEDLSQELRNCRISLEHREGEWKSVSDDNVELQETVREQEDQLANLRDALETLRLDHELEQKTHQESKNRLRAEESGDIAAQMEVTMEKRLLEIQTAYQESESEALKKVVDEKERLQTQLSASMLEIKRLVDEHMNTMDEVTAKYTEEIRIFREEKDVLTTELDNLKTSSSNEIRELNNSLRKEDIDLKEKDETIATLRSKSAEILLQKLQEQKDQLESEFTARKKDIVEKSKQIIVTARKKEKEMSSKLTEQHLKLQEDITKLEGQGREYVEENTALKNQLIALEDEIQNAKDQKVEIESLRAKADTMEQQEIVLRRQMEEVKQSHQESLQQLRNTKEDIVYAHESEIRLNYDKLKEAEDRLNAAESEHEKFKQKSSQAMKKAKMEQSSAEERFHKISADLETRDLQVLKLEEKLSIIEVLKQRVEEMDSVIQIKDEALDAHSKEILEFKSKVENDAEDQRNVVSTLRSEFESKCMECDTLRNDLKKQTKSRSDAARQLIVKKDEELALLQVKLRDAMDEAVKAKQQLQHHVDNSGEFQFVQLAQAQARRDAEVKRLERSVKSLEQQLTESQKAATLHQEEDTSKPVTSGKFEYVKNVMIKYLEAPEDSKSQLVPVIATILEFSPEELSRVSQAQTTTTGGLFSYFSTPVKKSVPRLSAAQVESHPVVKEEEEDDDVSIDSL